MAILKYFAILAVVWKRVLFSGILTCAQFSLILNLKNPFIFALFFSLLVQSLGNIFNEMWYEAAILSKHSQLSDRKITT